MFKDFFKSREIPSGVHVTIVKGDITEQRVDVIVNAANESLLGGRGVDGAIHMAAGRRLYEECKTLGGCNTGSAKMTDAYNLPSKKVIHAVGPDCDIYTPDEAEKLLRSCYETSLKIAEDNGLTSIAFPAISTGIYGYPIEDAVKVVHKVVDEFKPKAKSVREIRFVQFSDKDNDVYKKEFGV